MENLTLLVLSVKTLGDLKNFFPEPSGFILLSPSQSPECRTDNRLSQIHRDDVSQLPFNFPGAISDVSPNLVFFSGDLLTLFTVHVRMKKLLSQTAWSMA
jgi:hypothetical protein